MPYPKPEETKADYISRFMSSEEAKADFPDEKQRLAVAHSMFERRNATDAYGRPLEDHPWPKVYTCSFIEPGLVFYQDLGECKVCGMEGTCETCDTKGENILVKQETLAKMAKTFVGKPVINLVHKDVLPETVANGEADGIVTRAWFDDKTGWWMCEFIVWDPATQKNCESVAYSVSCAYEPTGIDNTGGQCHRVAYQEEVTDGVYTHLAIVTNPRYEGARIFVNSKGGVMSMWKFWQKKGSRNNAAELDPAKTMVNVDGKDVPLHELVAASKEDMPPAPPVLNDDTMVEVDGKEKSLGDLKNAWRNKQKKNAGDIPVPAADAACPSCKGSGKKAEPALNAESPKPAAGAPAEPPKPAAEAPKANAEAPKPAGEAPLPDLRDPKANAGGAPAPESPAHEDAEKAAAEAARKNAEEAAAKEKAEKERLNSIEAARAARREAGKASFDALRNARTERTTDAVKITPVSMDERLAAGRKKYGSAA